MRVFISGATGVIGCRVIPILLSRGHAVTAVARSAESRAHLEREGAKCASVDVFDADALAKAVGGHDAVINLATHMPSPTWKMAFRSAWRENDRLRTQGVANLVDAALRSNVGTLIQESFALTYPDLGSDWIDESVALEPSAYNRTVLDAERSIESFREHRGRGIVLRFAAFYGPDAMQLHTYIDGVRRGWALLPGEPAAYVSSVSHDDAATATVAALDAPAGTYNVSDDEPVSRLDFFASLAAALGIQPPAFLPRWITPLLGSVGDAMGRSLRLSNAKLRNATGWTPRFRSVREGWPVVLAQMEHDQTFSTSAT